MKMIFQWPRAAAFGERVERLNLHGLHFQHVGLCERRAWMYLHGVNFAHWNARVQIGTARHSTSHLRDHSVAGLFGLAPDRVDWAARIVYESKGTAGAVEAVSDQTAFYAVMLSIASGETWRAAITILSNRRQREVPLTPEQLERLWQASEKLQTLAVQTKAPKVKRIGLCESCSLAAFCDYD